MCRVWTCLLSAADPLWLYLHVVSAVQTAPPPSTTTQDGRSWEETSEPGAPSSKEPKITVCGTPYNKGNVRSAEAAWTLPVYNFERSGEAHVPEWSQSCFVAFVRTVFLWVRSAMHSSHPILSTVHCPFPLCTVCVVSLPIMKHEIPKISGEGMVEGSAMVQFQSSVHNKKMESMVG